MTDDVTEQELLPDEERRRRSRNAWVGLGAFLAVVIGIVVAVAIGISGQGASDDYAIAVCQTATKGRLKDPGSASFAHSPTLTHNSDGHVETVTGTGHASNSLGGTVPFTYSCSIALVEGEYRASNVQMSE